MYRARRYSKRAVAVFLSLMIVISAISSLFTGFSSMALSVGDVEILTSTDGLTPEKSVIDSTNVAIGFQKTPEQGVKTINGHNPSNLTDGDFGSQAEFYWSESPFFDVATGTDSQGNPYTGATKEYAAIGTQYLDGSERFLQVTVPLKGITDISNILVVNHSTSTLTTYYYEVFAANSEASLFDAANSVYKYTNTEMNQVQNFKIAEGKLTGMTYIGLRVYNPCYTDANGKWDEQFIANGNGVNIYYPRIFEFNAYGTVTGANNTVFDVASNDEQTIPSDLGDKAFSDVTADFYDSHNANTATYNSANLGNLVDGNASTEKQFMTDANNAVFTENGGEYMNFDFAIKDNFIIRKLLLINHSEPDLATNRYDVFVSDTEAGLDTAAPIASYKNTSNDATQLFTVKDTAGLKAKYLRVKVYSPVNWTLFNRPANYAVCRFMEMGVYGEYDASAKFKYNVVHNNNNDNLTFPTATNLTSGITPQVRYYNAVEGKNVETFSSDVNRLNDADPSTDFLTGNSSPHTYMDGETLKWYTKADGVYTEVTYNLGTIDTISDIVITNHSTTDIRMGSYEVYVAEKLIDLDKSESLVGTISTNGNRQQTISFTETVQAQYVRLRTYDVCYNKAWSSVSRDSVYFRATDFTVHGTKGTESAEENIVLEESNDTTSPATGKTSVVKSAKYMSKSYNSSVATAIEPSKGDSTLGLLTDGNANGEVEFYSSYAEGTTDTVTKIYSDGTAHTDIIYTLDGVAEISDIVVMGHEQPELWAISYDIYAGNSLGNLFNSEPVYSFKNTSLKRTQHFTFKDLKAAYVAIRITSSTATTNVSDYAYYAGLFGASIIHPRICEFNVYGTAGEPLDAVDFSEGDLSLPAGNSIVYATTVKYFDGTNEVGIVPSTLPNLADGNISNEFMGSDLISPFAKPGSNPIELYTDRYMKITHTLYNDAEISDIFVYNHSTRDLRTYKYKIYASDSEATLYDEANLVYDFTNSNVSRAQLYKTVKAAKYVGMIITDPCTQPFASERHAEQIYPRLWEFNVFGTGTKPSGSEITPTDGVTDYGDTTMPSAGTNFLKGMMASTTKAHNKVLNKSAAVGGSDALANLTDENVISGWHTGTIHGNIYFACWDAENNQPVLNVNGDVYVDITYNLGGTATVDKMYFGHHETPQRRMGKWEIYMSDSDDEDLYSAENLVKTVTNPNAARGQLVTFDAPQVGVRNIGIRIINPVTDEVFALSEITSGNYDSSCNVYPRLNEIAAYGSFEKDPFVFQRVINNSSATLPTGVDLSGLDNLSVPFTPIMQGTNLKTNEVKKVSSSGSAKMKDGNLKTEAEVPGYTFAEWLGDKAVYYVTGERYLDIYYDLGSEADIDYIVWGNHSTPELVTGKYDVYIGNSKTDLYNKNNLYASVDNIKTYDKGGSNQVNVIAFDEAQTGVSSKVRYVGVRIHTPVCAVEATETVTVTSKINHIYPRIMEFSVYGKYTDPTYVPGQKKFKDTKDMDIAKDILSKGENLLGKDNLSFMKDGKKITLSGGDATANNNLWKDNTGELHYDYNALGSSNGVLIFKLDKYDITQVSGFAFQGISTDSEPHYASHIRVHVCEEREDVLLDSSVVLEYNLEEDGINKGIYYEFPKNSEPQGCFLALEFINPVYTADQHVYPRISLLYAWGKEAVIRAVPANIAENMPIDIFFNNDGELTEVSESNLTATETKKLTDGDKSTVAKINTKGSDRDTMELIYNLCGDINIDKITISTLINDTTGFKTMKVYAAESIAMVNDESSLVWTYKVGSKTGTLTPSKSFTPAKKMRYLRFVFEGTKDYLVLGEIEAIGMDNQKMKTRTITSSLGAENITFTRTDMETGKATFVSANDSYLEGLIDADEGTAFTFYDGTVGKDKYDIQIYLGDLRTVSNITNNFFKHFMEYTPASINVYISETLAGITDENAEPTYVIKREDIKNGVYSKQLRPMLARYIRFEIEDFDVMKHFINPDGTPRITAIIGDIKIVGTKVKGLQTSEEDETLLTFHDDKTDMDVSILRLNNEINDIFTDAVSVRVTPEKATNWQMRSLQNNGSFEVVDKKIYKIEFLDLYGKVVKDLGEREIKISFKTPEGYGDNGTMIGDASQRTKITGLETYQTSGRTEAVNSWNVDSDNKVALLGMVTSDDPYWETIGELENFEEGNEDDLKGDGNAEIHDASWYDSIHTEDGLFTVTPINFQFDNGLKFVAEDISATAPIERYEAVLGQSDGKKVAIYYDMKLLKDGEKFDVGGEWVEITMDTAALASDYSDLEIFHVDDTGMVSGLWSMTDGTDFIFQTNSFSDFVLVGTALDGSSSIKDGTAEDGLLGSDGTSPSTGEDMRTLYVVLLFMVAAGYVAIRFGKKATNK